MNATNSILSDLSASDFNNHYTSIGETLSNSVEPTVASAAHHPYTVVPYLTRHPHSGNNNEFKYSDITPFILYKHLKNLSGDEKHGPLNICNRILKELAATIAPTLAHIYNLSLQTAVVPVDFKIAMVTPVYKRKGAHTNVNNYRSISITPTLGKILEKIVKDQLESYCK